MVRFKKWIVLMAVIVMTGCTGSDQSNTAPGQLIEQIPVLQLISTQMPAIPVDRATEAAFSYELNGIDTYDRSANAIANGTALDLISGSNNIAWGIWQFGDLANLSQVLAVIDVSPGEAVYLALADFTSGTWDFDGPLSAGKTITLDESRHRSEAGNFYIAALSSGGDAPSIIKLVLTTESDWMVVSVDDTGQAAHTVLSVVNGNPAICYMDVQNDQLRFVRAADATGTAWASPLNVLSEHLEGGYPDLKIINGVPAISFAAHFDFPEFFNSVHFVQANDFNGQTWKTPVDVDEQFEIGIVDTALRAVDGKPALVYAGAKSFGNNSLRFARALDAGGSAWGAPQILEAGSSALDHVSLLLEAGLPLICYEDTTQKQLKLVGATNAAGTAWNPPQIVAANLGAGNAAYPCGAIVAGLLKIGYYDHAVGQLKFARWNVPAQDWDHLEITGKSGVYGYQYISMALTGGQPAICFQDLNENSLKFVRATDPSGSSWGDPVTVDTHGSVGAHASLAEVNGRAAMCYTTLSGELRYAYQIDP